MMSHSPGSRGEAAEGATTRVLMVTSTLARGGSERQMLATAHGLLRAGCHVEIFEIAHLDAGYFTFADEFSRLGVRIRSAADFGDSAIGDGETADAFGLGPYASLFETFGSTALARALARSIEDTRPSVVHCWSDYTNVLGGFVATRLGVPKVVLAQRNVAPFRQGLPVSTVDLYRAAYRALRLDPTVVMLNNSRACRRDYEEWLDIPSGTIKLLPNGLLPNSVRIRDPREISRCRSQLGLPTDAPVVGAVMRFAPEKDPDLWFDVAAMIAAARPDARFILAGYGDLADRVRQRVHESGLTDQFVLPGPALDVGLMYASMDVFLLTSRFEGVPNVLLEAQASGLPVVAPVVGGVAEAVLDGSTGLLVEDRTPAGLATAVLRVLEKPDWRERAASHGPAFIARQFDYQRMIGETMSIYGLHATLAGEPRRPT
jgi:glycosyltransferase involved in cell wall biosynthesis